MKSPWHLLLFVFLVANLICACGFFQTAGSENKPAVAESGTTSSTAAAVHPSASLPAPLPPAKAAPTAMSVKTAAPTKPFSPTIVKAFDIAKISGRKGVDGPILALPELVWTASYLGGLQAWDSQTGELKKSISSIKAIDYYDIQTEGSHLWVLASVKAGDSADTLFVLGLPSGKLIKKFTLASPREKDSTYNLIPTRIGLSPARVWVDDMTIDTTTLKETHYKDGLPSEARFAYDGQGWMWMNGGWCSGCGHDDWIVNANDPTQWKDDQHSGMLNVSSLEQPLLLANGKIWFVQTEGPSFTKKYLVAYDPHKADQPVVHVEVNSKDKPFASLMAADHQELWIDSGKMLLYYSLADGNYLGSLPIGEDIKSIGFDGSYLWVSSLEAGLVKIAVP